MGCRAFFLASWAAFRIAVLFGSPGAMVGGKGEWRGVGLDLRMVQFEHFSASIMKYRALVVLWVEGKAHRVPGPWVGKE